MHSSDQIVVYNNKLRFLGAVFNFCKFWARKKLMLSILVYTQRSEHRQTFNTRKEYFLYAVYNIYIYACTIVHT